MLVFAPARRKGLIFHLLLLAVLLGVSLGSIFTGLRPENGRYFIWALLITLVFFLPVPPLLYSLYALLRARYTLDRDGMHLAWGLRTEDIPMAEVEWARLAAELPVNLPSPRPDWPGTLLGSVATDELGVVEFLASQRDTLVLVAAHRRVYAISPQDPQAFIAEYQRVAELGSLSPISRASVLPAAYAQRVWSSRTARALMLAGLAAAMVLFVVVAIAISTNTDISLGFAPDGSRLPPSPSSQLLLLPALAGFFYLVNLVFGLFFYRYESTRSLSYLSWGGSILTSILFFAAVFFVL